MVSDAMAPDVPLREAVVGAQEAPVMAAGRVQLIEIFPVKPPVCTSVTDAVPDCPGDEIVTFWTG